MRRVLCFLLVFSTFTLCAQNEYVRDLISNGSVLKEVTDIPASAIQFWVGEGENSVVAGFFWCGSTPGGVAYGYRFSGSATIADMLNAIASADPNFYIDLGSWVNGFGYSNGSLNYMEDSGMLMYTVNGSFSSGLSDPLADGDYFEMCQYADCTLPNENIFYPVNPNLPPENEDATIMAEEIDYWVGNGESYAIVAVNWCDTAICLAWGVRFPGDSALVADLMRTIAIYDERFDYLANGSMMSDITFNDGNYSLALAGDWWMYNINGQGAVNGFTTQYVHDGDVVKWGDESCGNADENFNYTWLTVVNPVAKPTPPQTQFDGIVGSENCQAISCEDPQIVGWAATCEVDRGWQNVENQMPAVTYGEAANAVGQVTNSTVEVVSLGDGGAALLTFDAPIQNGVGYDFAVFENALNDIFLELAFVEVSSDGVHFYRFPATSLTSTALQISSTGTVDAQNLSNLAGKYKVGWGTPFDLAQLSGYSNLDLNAITHIKVVDVVGSVDAQWATFDRNGNAINDPYPTDFASGGFDLAGVAVMNGWMPVGVEENSTADCWKVFPNPCCNSVQISDLKINTPISLYNAYGQLLWQGIASDSRFVLDLSTFADGFYLLNSGGKVVKLLKKQ